MDQAFLDQVENDLSLFELGRQLRMIVNTPAWEIVLDTLNSYVEDADKQVRKMLPGSPEVMAAQAALYALDNLSTKFKEDIERAVNFANNPSDEVKQYINGTRDANDVAKAMGQGV
jgi:hypothetical protein